MQVRILKSKLHLATVTAAELLYHGSITIPEELMEATGLLPFEQVLVANCNSGQRGETYVLVGKRGSGQIQMNGAMARLALPGDRVIVMAFADCTPAEARAMKPQVAILNERNEIVETL
jgi:aspartate 1-decarboxylase